MKRLFILALTIVLLVGTPAEAGTRFVGSKQTKKLHDSTHAACRQYIKQTKKANRVYFKSKKAARKAGYMSCKKC